MASTSPLFDEWRDKALCHKLVHELEYFTQKEAYRLFFPTRHSNAASSRSARVLCGFCPVSEECRSHALAKGEKFGIRGGSTSDDRRRVRSIKAASRYEPMEDYLEEAG